MRILICFHHRSHARTQKPASTSFPIRLTSRLGGHDTTTNTTNPSLLFLVLVPGLLHRRQSIRPNILLSSLESSPLPLLALAEVPKGNPCFKSGQAKLLDETKNGPHVAVDAAEARVAYADLDHLLGI